MTAGRQTTPWRCEQHPDLTPGERFPSDGGGPYCLACKSGRQRTSDEPSFEEVLAHPTYQAGFDHELLPHLIVERCRCAAVHAGPCSSGREATVLAPTLVWRQGDDTPTTVAAPLVDERGRPLPGEWAKYQQRLREATEGRVASMKSPDLLILDDLPPTHCTMLCAHPDGCACPCAECDPVSPPAREATT